MVNKNKILTNQVKFSRENLLKNSRKKAKTKKKTVDKRNINK